MSTGVMLMNKERLIAIVSQQLKLIRTELDYTQDQMAEVVGISKKTLVQIEKGRLTAGWTVTVAVCALFRESAILQNAIGSDPIELVEVAAHPEVRKRQSAVQADDGWEEIGKWQNYMLQQHRVGEHYRIVLEREGRLFSTADRERAMEEFKNYMNI